MAMTQASLKAFNEDPNTLEVCAHAHITSWTSYPGDLVMLRRSTVGVINLMTGESTLAYAQYDIASQATLISES